MSVAGSDAPDTGASEDVSKQTRADATVMDGLSSSKVTVEYHDPSGVFSLVQEDLTSLLPLRNLHWKAPTRPLRSIDSLHVDLVPSKDSVSTASSALAPPQGGTPTRTTEEIIRPPVVKEKERRHQIPGLRQTPYLKVYLLRCDDSDTYKSTARKQVREWVKEHTPPSQSSSSSTQENHDAYEWMIIHVVVPDTPAAAQPRGSSSAAIGEKEKSGSASVWKRGTSTLLEKLRADFNISSKTAPDRVAQIRLDKGKVPPHILPAAGAITSPPLAETPQEQERAWSEVIVRFKTLILLSFDLRVSQYEEDIRKNDSQRSFPGWNFNTFFILKEGLARGFESVGLVEDALLGYDELSIGLDTVISDQSKEGSEAQGATILNCSQDLYEQTTNMIDNAQSQGGEKDTSYLHDERPINAQRKDYRGLILANNISIFDFRVYVFARQMSLLLRLGNSHSARSDLAAKLQPQQGSDSTAGKPGSQANDSEDLFSLAELCSRAINFITFAGRLLRDDLVNGAKQHETVFSQEVVDNIVRSWTYAALEQILRETSTASLPFTRYLQELSTGSSGKSLSFGGPGKEQKMRVAEQKSMAHPSRSSSLTPGRSTEPLYTQPTLTGQVVYENGQYQDRPHPQQDSSLPQTKNGLQELAGTRAQLVVIQRRLLEQIGKALTWDIGWAAIIPSLDYSKELEDVNLDEEDEEADEVATNSRHKPSSTEATVGICADALKSAVTSVERFRAAYEALSDLIVKHYMAAGQNKSAESILGDLAALRFELGDFAAAAAYFGRMSSMSSMFAESRWNTVETTMLKMYARCLKKLNRKDEYVRTLLELLAKSAASRMSFQSTSRRANANDISDMPNSWLNDDKVDTTAVFNDLVSFSQQLPYDVTVQMAKYFGDISVEPMVRHYEDKDGFQLGFQFRHVLEDQVEIRAAKVRLISASPNQTKEIWLESTELTQLKKGLNRLWLGCNVNTIGPYLVDKIVLEAKRIVFVHEPFAKTEAKTPLEISTSVSAHSVKAAKKAQVMCFPRTEALDARIYLSRFIHIDKPRHIEIECSAGWNEITRAEIRLKSASAGLRLHTAKTTVESGEVILVDQSKPGTLTLGATAADSSAILKVPYDVETALQELTIKIEVDYHTANGQFHYFSSFTIPVDLPLDVNVHDHFKMDSLLSKFNIKTATHVPLQLLDVDLQSSEEFDVHAPKRSKEPVYVFPKQPVAITYKIIKKNSDKASRGKNKAPTTSSLALSVEYRLLNEDVRDRICQLFASDVTKSPVQRLSRLLIKTFSDYLEERVLPYQFERIALLDMVNMSAYEDAAWAQCLANLPQSDYVATRAWLQKWHESNKSIGLQLGSDQSAIVAPPSPYPARHIIITVSIPQTHILHTASLTPAPSPTPTIATMGQPMLTTLRISHTRRWAAPASLLAAANISSSSDPVDFVYTIEANPDTWLVAGQRRANFSANEDEVKEWSVLLVPLKAGVALLPNVEIRAKIKPLEDGKEAEHLACETDYLSYGETVMVVPDVRSSTVGIGDMSLGSPRSVVWIESVGQ